MYSRKYEIVKTFERTQTLVHSLSTEKGKYTLDKPDFRGIAIKLIVGSVSASASALACTTTTPTSSN